MIVYLQSQAQECVYERMILNLGPSTKFSDCVVFSQEAAMVASMYEETHNAVSSKSVRNDVPASWLTITIMKFNHYLAMAHYYLASALLTSKGEPYALFTLQLLNNFLSLYIISFL